MRMHANYGGLLNGRLKMVREEDQQDAVVLDETQPTTTDEVTTETPTDTVAEVPADVVAEVPAETAAVDTPADGDAFVDVVATDTVVDPSAAEVTATGEVAETPLDVAAETPADVVADTEPLADPLAEDPVLDAPVEDGEAAASTDATVADTTADVTTDVDSGASVDAGTDAEADAAADASAAATVADAGVDATGDTLAETVEETPATDAVVETTDTETPADVNAADVTEGEVAVADVEGAPVVGGEAPADTTAEVPTDTPAEEVPPVEEIPADPAADAEIASAAIPDLAVGSVVLDPVVEEPDVGTVEGGDTGEAGLTEEVAVNDGETTEVDQIDNSLLEPGVTEADTDIDGVNAYNDDVVDMSDELDDVTDVAQEIEVAVESMRIIAQNGGMDRSGGTFMNLHMQSLYKRIPGMDVKSHRVSMEAFGGATMSRVDGTTLAMEEAKGNLRKILDQIIEMIHNSIQYIKEAFKKFFDEATALYAKAKKIKEQASKITGSPTIDAFTDNGLARALFMNNGSVYAVNAADRLADETRNVLGNLVQNGYNQSEILMHVLNSSGSTDALAKNVRSLAITGDHVSAETVGIAVQAEGLVIARGKPLPGNKAVVSVYPASNNPDNITLSKISNRLATYDTSISPPEGIKLEVLNRSDIIRVIDKVMIVIGYVLAFKKNTGKIDKMKQDLVNAVKTQVDADHAVADVINNSGTGLKMEPKLSQTDAVALAKCSAQLIDQPASSFMPYALTTSRALLHCAEKSLAAHGATQAETAKAAA